MFQSPDNPTPKTLEKPVLPDNYDSLGPDELHRRRVLFYLYMLFDSGLNERHLSGMRDPHVLLTQHLGGANHILVEKSDMVVQQIYAFKIDHKRKSDRMRFTISSRPRGFLLSYRNQIVLRRFP
ncbi:predicted protein [Histoplasma capsulatum G186AR]|uniref:Uncharacterized protein n=1 Tax=Ajellomyces capsulatus (strain G186AR / H82 / ATCC MYA-2454 / RMSCC 2432) TaxID=447093 RepID=C0ND03_AJECG|nr:uncharacterized protein HCBG_00999 [Histoplasma capsulatum G186AR]EEH11544.1 predicted protein [Histoplasma capsulatum G186AR]